MAATKPKESTAAVDAEFVQENAVARVPAPAQAVFNLAAQAASRPHLAGALVKAMIAAHGVEKDSKNSFHKYEYASSEALIEEARTALAANGLAVVPVEQSVNGWEREGENRFELVQTRMILHISGECIVCRSAWPIVPDRGRPLDKATAAADTLSLAYFLRDLLQLPRVDKQADVNTRDDREYKPQPAPQPQPQMPGCISRVQGAALADAMKRQGADPDMLFEEYAIHRLGEMPETHFKDALARINRGDFTPSTKSQPAGVQ